ncbi:MAG: hypothetical protein E7281_02985 [Lachnospiraceae bacterium]|nr:hypothetical protein [Lachnospiraceae bacterium]
MKRVVHLNAVLILLIYIDILFMHYKSIDIILGHEIWNYLLYAMGIVGIITSIYLAMKINKLSILLVISRVIFWFGLLALCIVKIRFGLGDDAFFSSLSLIVVSGGMMNAFSTNIERG